MSSDENLRSIMEFTRGRNPRYILVNLVSSSIDELNSWILPSLSLIVTIEFADLDISIRKIGN